MDAGRPDVLARRAGFRFAGLALLLPTAGLAGVAVVQLKRQVVGGESQAQDCPGVVEQEGALLAGVRAQDAERLPGALNRLKVSPGDVYVIPAGLPHAIGAGVMMIEVQEPSDWSIHAEYAPFGLGEDEAHQGFGWEAAFEALDAVACTPEDIRQRLKQETPVVRQVGDSVERRLIAPEYAGYFGASEATVRGALPLEGGRLAIGLVDAGEGRVEAGGGALSLARGTTFVLPAAASDARLVSSGGDALRVTLCYPPAA